MPMLSRLILLLALSLLPRAASAAPVKALPGTERVAIETDLGRIIVAVDLRRAPLTAANFMTYVDDRRFDGVTFYRAARRKNAPTLGLIQGGIDTDLRRALPPVRHEPTSKTGIRHLDATISMARPDRPNSAMGNFFITVGATPRMDAVGDYIGYAAFGRVVSGMEAVKRILGQPTCCGSGPMRGQMIVKPVRILRVVRLDGVAKPTKGVRPWLIGINRKPAPR